MAIFELRSTTKSLIIRSNCISCVRQMAVEGSPSDEFNLWSDKQSTTVTLIRNHPLYDSKGPRGILERISHE